MKEMRNWFKPNHDLTGFLNTIEAWHHVSFVYLQKLKSVIPMKNNCRFMVIVFSNNKSNFHFKGFLLHPDWLMICFPLKPITFFKMQQKMLVCGLGEVGCTQPIFFKIRQCAKWVTRPQNMQNDLCKNIDNFFGISSKIVLHAASFLWFLQVSKNFNFMQKLWFLGFSNFSAYLFL